MTRGANFTTCPRRHTPMLRSCMIRIVVERGGSKGDNIIMHGISTLQPSHLLLSLRFIVLAPLDGSECLDSLIYM